MPYNLAGPYGDLTHGFAGRSGQRFARALVSGLDIPDWAVEFEPKTRSRWFSGLAWLLKKMRIPHRWVNG